MSGLDVVALDGGLFDHRAALRRRDADPRLWDSSLAERFDLLIGHPQLAQVFRSHRTEIALFDVETTDAAAVLAGDEFGLRRVELGTVEQCQVVAFGDSNADIIGVHFFQAAIDVRGDGRQPTFVKVDRPDGPDGACHVPGLRQRRSNPDQTPSSGLDRDRLSVAASRTGRFDQFHRTDGAASGFRRRRRAHHRADIAFRFARCLFGGLVACAPESVFGHPSGPLCHSDQEQNQCDDGDSHRRVHACAQQPVQAAQFCEDGLRSPRTSRWRCSAFRTATGVCRSVRVGFIFRIVCVHGCLVGWPKKSKRNRDDLP